MSEPETAMTFAANFTMTINGRAAAGAGVFDVVNPATGAVIASVPDCSPEQLDEAVAAARAAFPAWSARPIEERKALLVKLGERLTAEADTLMRLLTQEQGKPHADAQFEVLGAGMWCQATAMLDLPVVVNEDTEERLSTTRRVPVGVVGAIAPWNFPLMLAIWKLAPALLAGNTVVLKPSPFTPLTSLRLGELTRDIFPAGVINVVTGGDNLGPWMTAHPDIDKISFTGSSAAGKKVMQSASATMKRLTLELGGNDAAIVLPDVDVAAVAKDLFWAGFRNSGQICVATKRLYVHADVYDALAEALVVVSKTIRMGDGAEQGVELGPIQNRMQYHRVCGLIDDARANGQTFLIGGEVPKGPGYFVPVTIVDNPPEDARVVQEEAFGPVLPMMKFNDIDDVVQRANASIYGLAGSVWSSDPDKAMAVASRLQCGTVWINEVQHLTPFVTFGGHGQSGFGVENGVEGLLEYTNAQTVTVRKLASAS
jgi:aldehyde dehydrogenase (NAD+)